MHTYDKETHSFVTCSKCQIYPKNKESLSNIRYFSLCHDISRFNTIYEVSFNIQLCLPCYFKPSLDWVIKIIQIHEKLMQFTDPDRITYFSDEYTFSS